MQKHGFKMTTHLKAGASVATAYANSAGKTQILYCEQDTAFCIEPTNKRDFIISCGEQQDNARSIISIKWYP